MPPAPPARVPRRSIRTAALAAAAATAATVVAVFSLPAPAQQPSAAPATAPAAATSMSFTAPAVPDPREAMILTEVTQLTRGFDRAGEGYFSADMKWVVFQAAPRGEPQYQMYVAPLDLGDGKAAPKLGAAVRVSPPNSRNTCGFFSPDGSTLIFGSTAGKEKPDEPSAGYQRQGGNYRWAFPDGMEIYRADLAAKTIRVESVVLRPVDATSTEVNDMVRSPNGLIPASTRPTNRPRAASQTTARTPELPNFASMGDLVHTVLLRSVGSVSVDLATPANRLTNNDAYDAEGAFSPDGKHICFTSRRTGDADVWVMRADGSHPVQITKTPHYDGGPFFSPDGKRLVYRSDRKGNDLLQIYVADLAFDAAGDVTGTTAERQLTDDANVNWGPYFHPDGKHIVYATSAHGHANYELYLMRDDGSKKTRVTYCAGFDGLPVFSPDGKYLMWSAKGRTADNTTQLFIARYHPPADGE